MDGSRGRGDPPGHGRCDEPVAETNENNNTYSQAVVVGRGAAVPYTEYEAEAGTYTGTLLTTDAERTFGHTNFATESSGRQSVRLTSQGQYVQLTSTNATNSIVVRNSIPDSADGMGQEATISLYANGTFVQKLTLSSKYSWLYGTTDQPEGLTNTPGGDARRLFDESHALLAQSYPAGTVFRLQRDAGDTAAFYIIDLVDLEQVAPALSKPADCTSITAYGAIPNDGIDDSTAIQAAVTADQNGQISCVWIPAGQWRQEKKILTDDPLNRGMYNQVGISNATIRGAGMWHSQLYSLIEPQDANTLNHPHEGNFGFDIDKFVQLSDIAIFGSGRIRGGDGNDEGGVGLNGRFGTGTAISNVWIEHANVGVWVGRDYDNIPDLWGPADRLQFTGMRIRNTYADGINFSNGTRNSRVFNCRLLADATGRAGTLGDGQRLALAALATQRLGARFAMPRAEVVDVLTSARQAVRGSGGRQEAQLTAALARELSHSVPTHRAQAPRLSSEALALARTLDDPATLAACLLARHDVLWTPGRASERTAVAREIVALAERTGDVERRAEGLLLTANALLEDGSAAFRPVLDEYLAVAEQFGQPRHDYLALTRRGALALIDGRLDEAESLIEEATALGERIGEPDVGNVRMSQQLGLVRARGEPPRLRETAAEAIRWWVGVPSHAHAVAAGLFAEAGELAEAARSLDAVRALGVWRDDRSYLWSVFVGGMATAAVRLADRDACAELLAELEPVTTACGVNGALVCFSGSNAHWAGLLADALGERERARDLLEHALAVHRRLGARVWEAESCAALAALESRANTPHGPVCWPPSWGCPGWPRS